jgi:hypothetical protein
MAEIVNGNIGPEASYDVSFAAGSANITVSYKGADASASLQLSISAVQLLSDLQAKASNEIEKAAIATVIALISKV